jgi:hypothetical protein
MGARINQVWFVLLICGLIDDEFTSRVFW